ncbi:hypothetical protein GUJ93_ZPchr0006g40981 [Zizania palustris]|uniref:SBP-type domain-containing protein n=1 Tax=Zizania palustris TaxID=103762 RepID=A0A8J5W2A0_ZIZPA|nr:hypothetical protein GUJ93_ZPchr0006g40981 [Zizania palustris]
MMSSRLNTGAMAPAADVVDFGYAPIQPYVGFDVPAGMGTAMASERPLFQPHHGLYDDDGLDFASAAAAFPSFQDASLCLSGQSGSAAGGNNLLQQLALHATPSSLQMPMMMTLPVLPATSDVYSFGSGHGGLLKREDGPVLDDGSGAGTSAGRIGLNLGHRTYFSPADVLAVDRLLLRSRLGGIGGMSMGMGVLGLGLGAAHHHHQPPRCQAEGCKVDLSAAKHYHRRHKVCDYHSKASAVVAGGKQQRFCQQCSRFHVLAEFDEAKRSCRKRLTEHNRRRRKPAGGVQGKCSPAPLKKAADSSINASSYNSEHKASASTTTGSGVSCLQELADNDDQTGGIAVEAVAAPTLSLAALPPREDEDGGLSTVLLMQQRVREDDTHHLISSLARQRHNSGANNNDNIPLCSTASKQQNSTCNGGMHFFEVDFI